MPERRVQEGQQNNHNTSDVGRLGSDGHVQKRGANGIIVGEGGTRR